MVFSPDSPKLVAKFRNFLREYYDDDVATLARRFPNDQKSLWIDHSDVYQFDPDLADDLVNRPRMLLECIERALLEYDLPVDVDLDAANARVYNLPTSCHPDDLDSSHIDTYVAVKGQLTRITGKNPRLRVACWECQRCGTPEDIPQGRNEVFEPHECAGCDRQGPFELNTSQSEFVDQRKIKLEEPIEARNQAHGEDVPVYVDDDLVDYGPGSTTLPEHAGEHATVVGIVRIDETQLAGRDNTPETRIWVEAKAITFDTDVEENINVRDHKPEFERLAAADDAPDLVAESLAPSLHAEEGEDLYVVRRACAAWLFNAYRLDPDGGPSKRGDMHMALIGDPGTGKSTLMAYLHRVLPKSEYRTGPGLTKVGLTAAAVNEEFAGESEWTLKPGVLPRADGGHCLIDEVDAVIDESTKAIHDALEGEQKVKADKAGIKADLPTRCAMLAGGNPTHTRFDPYEPITEQIDLDPALFDRMDLVFSLQDQVDENRDKTKALHTTDVWDDLAQVEQGSLSANEGESTHALVPTDVLRAWVKYARNNVFPTLSAGAKDELVDYYVEVRDLNDGYDGDGNEAVPATPRTLESAIRLSMAFARLRLSETVEVQDANRAIELSKKVVGLRFDRESGQFDDRMTASGKTKSQKSRKETVLDAIGELQDEGDSVGASMVDIKEMIDAPARKVEKDVATFVREGRVYERRNDQYRLS
jgi:replicative DNA helicase Mcm